MKRVPAAIISLLLTFGCSSYNVDIEIENSTKLSQLKKSGIVFRIIRGSLIRYDDYTRSLQFWLNSYKKINDLQIITTTIDRISYFPSELERFYQLSINKDFQRHKSKGVIELNLYEHEKEIKSLMESKSLDSLIIYEVDAIYSTEMQFVDFSTVIAVIDADFRVLYLDHQKLNEDIDEFDPSRAKNILLDRIGKRLLGLLSDLHYIDDK